MFRSFILSLLFFSLGCKNEITSNEIYLLSGYWNIEYITQKNETFHPKGKAKLLDYYKVNKQGGVRKKVQPRLNNKFLVTEDINNFKIIFKDGSCYLIFQTSWDQWQEKIVDLNKNKLVLEHQHKRYHYKKFHSEH
tara:strand:+ start:3409 stop:3816 length:408 start_codon:yes stop_codon:yes gene_type:complete